MSRKGPVDIETQILRHYIRRKPRKTQRSSSQHSASSQPIELTSPLDHSFRLQQYSRSWRRIIPDNDQLEMREMPRGMKIFFPCKPEPPPPLEPIPYTYEVVPLQPVKWPKRRPGQLSQWVIQNIYRMRDEHKFLSRRRDRHKFSERGMMLIRRFQKTVRELIKELRLSKSAVQQFQKGTVKKTDILQFHNSKQFFQLVKKGKDKCLTLIKENPQLLKDRDEQNLTALHWAAREGFHNLIKAFAAREDHEQPRVNVDARDIYNRTPLHFAVANQKVQCIYRLVIEGARTNLMDVNKKFVKDVAPNVYIKYVLQKVEEARFTVNAKNIKKHSEYKAELEKEIRNTLNPNSLYF